jgi:glucan phosphoethanolaminetransferase (alkaline phosphatase superfamily)
MWLKIYDEVELNEAIRTKDIKQIENYGVYCIIRTYDNELIKTDQTFSQVMRQLEGEK